MKEDLGIKIMIFIILIMNVFTFFKLSKVSDFYDVSYPKITGDCSRETKAELRKFAIQFKKNGSLPRERKNAKNDFKGINILDENKHLYYFFIRGENYQDYFDASFDYIKYNEKFSFLISNGIPASPGTMKKIYAEDLSLYILKEEFSEDEIYEIFDKIYEINFPYESEQIDYEKSPEWNKFVEDFPKLKNFIRVGESELMQGDKKYFPLIIQNSEKNFFFVETVESEAEKLSMRSFDAVDFADKDGNLIPLKKCHCIFDPIGFRAY